MIENENYIDCLTVDNIENKIDKQISNIERNLETYSDDLDQVKAFNIKLSRFKFMKEWIRSGLY